MYELLIGWRYVYRGKGSRKAAIGFGVSLAFTLLGAALFFSTGGSSGFAVFALAGGMFGAVTSALLYFLTVFTTVSVLGVVLGVAALTVVFAVTSGFEDEFRDKVLGVNAHVIIMKNSNDFAEYRDVEETARKIDPDVLAVQPFIFVEMLVTRGKGELSGVAVKGIDPDRVSSVLDLHKHLVDGSVDSLKVRPEGDDPPPIILGQELARKLKADVGDRLTVVAPLSGDDFENFGAESDSPRAREFIVTGIFYSGFDEYDRRLMYVHIAEAQDLWGQGDQVMGVELKIRDVERASEIAGLLDKALGGRYAVQDWHQLNHNLFTALALQKITLVVILTLIVAVAAFNMVSALTMMVIDKTREVAILKSMGSSSSGIARVFQVVGVVIGGVGTVFGLTIGLVLCKVVATYDYKLDPKVYLIDSLPLSITASDIVVIGIVTMIISALATLVPSYRAASLHPVEGLRYD
jgi:lipoprotein-releasing system permease protein